MNDNVEFYEAFAPYYEAYYHRVDAAAAVRQWLARMEALHVVPSEEERLVQAPALLDLGCGPGWHLHEWAAARFIVSGLDASPAMLRVTRRNCAAAGAQGAAMPQLFCADIRDTASLETLRGSYHVAVGHFNFLNLFAPAELPSVFASISTLLSPAGVFVTDLTLPGANDTDANPAARYIHQPLPPWEATETYWLHSPGSLARIAGQNGLSLADSSAWDTNSIQGKFTNLKPNSMKAWVIFRRRLTYNFSNGPLQG